VIKKKMKKKIEALVGLALCAMLLVSPALASDVGTLEIYGNANEDDTIDMRDLTYVKLIFFGKKPETELADAKYDGKINPLDFIQIKLIIVGKEKELTVIDNAERIVSLKKPIERIVMLSTDSAEVLRAAGVTDKIIGVDDYLAKKTIYFPEFAKLPTVGSCFHPDWEAILSLKPDIVFAYSSALSHFGGIPETLDIPVVGFSACKIYTRDVQLREIGYIIGDAEGAEELIEFYQSITDPIAQEVEEIPEEEKPRVYIECYKNYHARTSPSGSHPMCVMAGGINIGADLPGVGTTAEIDPEWLVKENPDIIVKVVSHSKASCGYGEDDLTEMEALREGIMNRPELANVNAVKNDTVYLLAVDICDRSSNSLGVAYLAKWFHPELFDDLDPEAIHREYLERFQGMPYQGVYVYPPLAS
jgi:iron complex transport system substrate-binding protein